MKILKPRNTLITVVEIKDRDKKTDAGIIVPGGSGGEYKLCEIVAVGPGMTSKAAEVEALDDLKPGQTVLVKLAARMRQGNQVGLAAIGLEYKDESGRDLKLVEQTNIVAIIEDDGQPAPLTDIKEEESETVAKIDGGSQIIQP